MVTPAAGLEDSILPTTVGVEGEGKQLGVLQIPGWEKSEVSDHLLQDVEGLYASEAVELRDGVRGYNHKIRVKEGATPKFQFYPEKNPMKRQAVDNRVPWVPVGGIRRQKRWLRLKGR
eukprot:Pgem_evm2s19034